MKYQTIGKNIVVTEAIKSTVEGKLARLNKFFPSQYDDVLCRAVVRSYRVGAKVEITIFTKAMDFRAEVRDNDLYAAVDLAIDKLEGQMRKLKTRLDHSNAPLGLGEAVVLENIEAEEAESEIVRTKSIYLEPMSLDEAITRMEALGHTFFVYLDNEDDQISICYKRMEGGYGVIQAENKLA